MGKTRKRSTRTGTKGYKGGKVIASGGFGCVFDPALKCANASKRETGKISKLMTERHAAQEYDEIQKIKAKLDTINRYEDYFLIYDATLCRPAKLTATDLTAFKKCSALPKDNITKGNVNAKLDEVMSLNIPNGGLPVDDFVYANGGYEKLYQTHVALVQLLKEGIIPMNRKHVYHSDIKDSNVLIDDRARAVKARLIDWGLTVDYDNTSTFPKNWRNRPLQFNVPFSVILFTDTFYTTYTEYLKDGGAVEELSLKPFVINYLSKWMKERGAGHYKFINEIMFLLYGSTLTNIPDANKPSVIETEVTVPRIVDYLVEVLLHHTKFKSDGSLNLREYLHEVYVKIVDIWGFVTVYYPLLEMFSNNASTLNDAERRILKQLQRLFTEYLFTPRAVQISITNLLDDLNVLGKLIYAVAHGKTSSTSSTGGAKTRKRMRSSSVFKRKALKKRFKKPYFLSLL